MIVNWEHFDEKRAITPKWVIGFTSKLQGRKILTCCKFLQLNLTSISYSFWNITQKVLKFSRTARQIFGREPSNDYFIKILFLLSKWFQTRRFLWEFPIGSYVKLIRLWWSSWSVFWNAGHNFGRGPPKNHFSKVWLRLAQ